MGLNFCVVCKKKINFPRRKFCSPKCLGIFWKSERYKKYKNTSWYKRYKKEMHKKELKDKEKHSARIRDYLKRDKKCNLCGSTKNLEFHHTNYKKKEGNTLCRECHNKCKGVKNGRNTS